MSRKDSNTAQWLEECSTRFEGRNPDEMVQISVGEFNSLVAKGFNMMDFADQLAATVPLYEACQNALGFMDTPIMRRTHGGSKFYEEVVEELRVIVEDDEQLDVAED